MKKLTLAKVNRGKNYYWERVDRNIGWLNREEQETLKRSVIGIAGNGGMGGLISSVFLRAGIGEIRIADKEVFDLSNMNRQFAARRKTVGKSKALETAKELRRITDDARLVVYTEGINKENADDFISGCDVILDEIEFFAVGARILLHRRARKLKVPVFNCDTVGFRTFCFLYTPKSATVEETLGISYKKGCALESEARRGSAAARKEIIKIIFKAFVPEIPQYKSGDEEILKRRLEKEGKASIVATNPPFATGFLADRVLLYILRNSNAPRPAVMPVPEMPGYLSLDAATMEAKIVKGKWWR